MYLVHDDKVVLYPLGVALGTDSGGKVSAVPHLPRFLSADRSLGEPLGQPLYQARFSWIYLLEAPLAPA